MNSATKRLLWFILVLALASKSVDGIRCWTCDGKQTLKECHEQLGRMKQCDNPDDVCQNDFRTAQGKPLITKGCKQQKACETEVKQNADKNQCGRKSSRNLVCRCCCNFDGCNAKASGCLPPPAPCKPPKAPGKGTVNCPKDIEFNSKCRFRCNRGFEIDGPPEVRCAKDKSDKSGKKGVWKPDKETTCKKIIIQCDPPKEAPENGFIQCKNTKEYGNPIKYPGLNYEGTECTYSCDKNHFLQGKKNTICSNSRRWSNEDPKCVRGSCAPGVVDENRIEECTSSYQFGSECTFRCKKGFNLIGSENSACRQMGSTSQGIWTKEFPRCAEVECHPKLTNPAQGKVSCTKGNVKGSVCTYTCDAGFDLDDTRLKSLDSVCEDDGDGDSIGKWSQESPTCSPIICQPVFTDPIGGQVVCTDRNIFNSVCTFTCNGENDLVGTKLPKVTSTCQGDDDGDGIGKWSKRNITCEPITCQPAFAETTFGKLDCTNANRKNSICTFKCANDFDLDGTTERTLTSTCLPPADGTAIGTWSRIEQPTCSVIRCPPQPFPDFGFRICSTSNFMRGTFCVFMCDDGYDITSQSYMSCQDQKQDGDSNGEWTASTPSCRLGQCQATEYDKSTVVEDCTPPDGYKVSEYRVGTKCTYRCKDEGYYMAPNTEEGVILSGEVVSECDIEKKWTNKPPRCLVKTCLPIVDYIENGYTPQCSNGNTFDSVCTFACQEKHALTHERPVVCVADSDNDQYGKWSEEFPTCKRSHCDDYGTVINGKLVCTNGTRIGSVCSLDCIDRYTTKKYEETACLTSARWSRRRYFCCVRCLFNRRVKITAAFDSSAFDSRESWQSIVDVTHSYLSQMVRYGFDVEFAAFGYATDIDQDTVIPLERLKTREDIDRVKTDLESMPFAGTRANTGQALNFINDVIFENMDENREHFVVLATAGKSMDEVEQISETMRARNINILAVELKSDETSDAELLQIAGIPRNVFPAAKPQDLSNIPAKINEISRSTGCTSASKTQRCP